MRDDKIPPVLFVYCSQCRGTTRWILSADQTQYECNGDVFHPDLKMYGCKRTIPRTEKHIKIMTEGGVHVA